MEAGVTFSEQEQGKESIERRNDPFRSRCALLFSSFRVPRSPDPPHAPHKRPTSRRLEYRKGDSEGARE